MFLQGRKREDICASLTSSTDCASNHRLPARHIFCREDLLTSPPSSSKTLQTVSLYPRINLIWPIGNPLPPLLHRQQLDERSKHILALGRVDGTFDFALLRILYSLEQKGE